MSIAGGPKLEGIGRGGDSNLVLEMDAHDAGSYPGEPTTNELFDPRTSLHYGWGSSYMLDSFPIAPTVAYSSSPNSFTAPVPVPGKIEFGTYWSKTWWEGDINLGASRAFSAGDTVMFSGWYLPWTSEESAIIAAGRGLGSNNMGLHVYSAAGGHGQALDLMPVAGGAQPVNGFNHWWYFEFLFTVPAGGVTGSVRIEDRGWDYYYNNSGSAGGAAVFDVKYYWCNVQIELKPYRTPLVRARQVLGAGGISPAHARPASTNLMIHGNVGHDSPNILSEALSKFETSSGWTVGQDWSINSGTEVAEITSWTQASFLQRAASPAEVTTGKRYTITADITSSAGVLYARVGNSSYAAMAAGIGSTVEVTCGGTATETVLFYSGGWTGTLDNVRVQLSEWIDSSPSKHVITPNGTVCPSSAQSKFPGGSIYFPTSGDYLRTGGANFLAGNWTVDCWFYYDGSFPSTIEGLIALDYDGTGGSSNNAMNVGVKAGAMALYVSSNVSSGWNIVNGTTGGTVSANAWHHGAVVFNGSYYRVFLDGIQVIEVASSTAVASQSSSQIIVGTTADGNSSQSWNGYIDEVRVTTGTALWLKSFTPPALPSRCPDGPVVDLSGHHNAGNFVTTDMTDARTYNKGQVIEPVASAVWDLDGTDDYISCGNDSSLNFGTGDFTIGFWVNITGWISNWAWPVSKAPGYSGMFIALTSPGYFRASLGAWFTDVIGSYSSEPAISFGTWYHFTLKRASGSVTAYLNGNQYGTSVANTYDLGTESANSFNIGLGPAASSLTNGRFAAVQAYKTALTAQQVKQNFNSQRSRFKV